MAIDMVKCYLFPIILIKAGHLTLRARRIMNMLELIHIIHITRLGQDMVVMIHKALHAVQD